MSHCNILSLNSDTLAKENKSIATSHHMNADFSDTCFMVTFKPTKNPTLHPSCVYFLNVKKEMQKSEVPHPKKRMK